MLSMRYHGGFRANDDNYAPDGDSVDNDQLNRKLILNENINIPIPNALGFGWLPVGTREPTNLLFDQDTEIEFCAV